MFWELALLLSSGENTCSVGPSKKGLIPIAGFRASGKTKAKPAPETYCIHFRTQWWKKSRKSVVLNVTHCH